MWLYVTIDTLISIIIRINHLSTIFLQLIDWKKKLNLSYNIFFSKELALGSQIKEC